MIGNDIQWKGGQIVVRTTRQVFDEDTGSMTHTVTESISGTPDEWTDFLADLASALAGKPNADGDWFALCPGGADPDDIGRAIAEKIHARARFRG